MLQVPRWLGSLSELPCIKKDSGRGYKRWCLLPQSADGRLVEAGLTKNESELPEGRQRQYAQWVCNL